jgi:hypothetical protein
VPPASSTLVVEDKEAPAKRENAAARGTSPQTLTKQLISLHEADQGQSCAQRVKKDNVACVSMPSGTSSAGIATACRVEQPANDSPKLTSDGHHWLAARQRCRSRAAILVR